MNVPNCLVGAGFLGHTWAVTARDAQTGGERLYGQTSSGPDAVRIFNEQPGYAVAIYERRKKRWRKVSIGYAAACPK